MQIPATPSGTAHAKRLSWGGIAALLLLLLLLVLGCIYRHHLVAGLDLVGEATGGRTSAALCVALAVLVLVGLIIWMLFPLFVYLGLRDLSRRTAELDQTMKLCAQHLARTSPEPPAVQAQKAPAGARDRGHIGP